MSTEIAWTDETWNPSLGCSRISEGCRNCYAERTAHRWASSPNPQVAAAYAGLTHVVNGRPAWTGVFRELPERLLQPLRWKRPRRIFVNSMSDLFGEGISDEYLDQVFAAMLLAPQHQFQILTKRPERMLAYFTRPTGAGRWLAVVRALDALVLKMPSLDYREPLVRWPLPNVWIGVSVEDQRAADERIPLLLQTPAAVRFLSCEPLLGPLDLPWLRVDYDLSRGKGGNLHWVIVGGESGPGARPCRVEWVRAVIHQCRAARVACFCKQIGSAWAHANGCSDYKGGCMAEWPEALRVREFPDGA